MKCQMCGSNIKEGNNICNVCGTSIDNLDINNMQNNINQQPISNNFNQQPMPNNFNTNIVNEFVCPCCKTRIPENQIYMYIQRPINMNTPNFINNGQPNNNPFIQNNSIPIQNSNENIGG